MDQNYALSLYPLSTDILRDLKNSLNQDFTGISVSSLRQYSPFKIIKKLRELKCQTLLIIIDDPSIEMIQATLLSIAFFTKAKNVQVYYKHRNSFSNFTKLQCISSLITFFLATIRCYVTLFKANYELKRILTRKYKKHAIDFSKPKKILYLKTNLWLGVKAGGSVGHVSGVINSFIKHNWDLFFCSAESPLMLSNKVKHMPISVSKNFGYPPELNNYVHHFQTVKQIKKKISNNKDKFTFIYQRMSVCNYTGPQISNYLKIPLVTEYNGSEVWVSKNWGRPLKFSKVAENAEEACLKYSDLIITVSEPLKEDLINRGVPNNKIVVYPNCIDPDIFDPTKITDETSNDVRKKYNLDQKHNVLTFIGTFGKWHGVDVLAQSIKSLVDNHQDWLDKNKVHFLIVGDGFEMPKIKKLIGHPPYKNYSTLTGLIPQDNAPSYLKTSDILLSPHVPNSDGSKFFGSPTKLFEYMAMKKPIIASKLEQIAEVLSESISVENMINDEPSHHPTARALLVKPGDITELTKAIMATVENPTWWDHLGNNARKEVENNYLWEHHTKAIIDGLKRQCKSS